MELPVSQRNNMFAFDLMKHFDDFSENLVISPFSISSAMGLAYAGASGNTKDEMVRTLYFDPEQKNFHRDFSKLQESIMANAREGVLLNIANNMWLQKDYAFKRSFVNILTRYYGVDVNQADFSRGDREIIRREINRWVFEETGEKIADLIAPGVLTEDTRLVLINAIHFMSNWMNIFDPALTRREYFTNFDGQKAETDFMVRRGSYAHFEGNGFSAIQLPYAGDRFSMLVFLPDKELSVSEFQKKLSADLFNNAIENLVFREVQLMFPRFKTETKSNLEMVLAAMGMPEAFTLNADFSRMTGRKELKIDQVVHKATIEVGEQGTEAAAATAVVIVQKSAAIPGDDPILFKADRPFLFFIIHNSSGSILFSGRQVKFSE